MMCDVNLSIIICYIYIYIGVQNVQYIYIGVQNVQYGVSSCVLIWCVT